MWFQTRSRHYSQACCRRLSENHDLRLAEDPRETCETPESLSLSPIFSVSPSSELKLRVPTATESRASGGSCSGIYFGVPPSPVSGRRDPGARDPSTTPAC